MFTKFYRIQKNGLTTDVKFLAINGKYLLEEGNNFVAYGVTENITNGVPRIVIFIIGDEKGNPCSEIEKRFKRLIIKSDKYSNKIYHRRKYEMISADSEHFLRTPSFRLERHFGIR